jgi:hypothetical protein
MSIAVDSSPYPHGGTIVQPLLREVPRLLEYRAEADPDAEFIPKTIAGFAGGFMLVGACIAIALVMTQAKPQLDVGKTVSTYLAFLFGIDMVAASLLLVGLKVRADHTGVDLFARHWLNSIGTGALFAIMIAGPWVLLDHHIYMNRFVAAGIWMLLMAFPAISAKWTVGPHPHLNRPGDM